MILFAMQLRSIRVLKRRLPRVQFFWFCFHNQIFVHLSRRQNAPDLVRDISSKYWLEQTNNKILYVQYATRVRVDEASEE